MLITPHVQFSSSWITEFLDAVGHESVFSLSPCQNHLSPNWHFRLVSSLVCSSFWPYLGRCAKHPCGLLVQHSTVSDFSRYIILNSSFPILSQRLQLLRHIKCINGVYWQVVYQFGNPTSVWPLSGFNRGSLAQVLGEAPTPCKPRAAFWVFLGRKLAASAPAPAASGFSPPLQCLIGFPGEGVLPPRQR